MNTIEISSGNVYADLGDVQAEEMLIKGRLAYKIGEIIRHRHLTQTDAAHLLGLTQPNCPTYCAGNLEALARPKCSIV